MKIAANFTVEAIEILEKIPDKKFLLGKAYMTMGVIYKNSNTQKSEEYFKKSIQIFDNGFNEFDKCFCLNKLGELLSSDDKRISESIYYLNTSLEIALKISKNKTNPNSIKILKLEGIYFNIHFKIR
jgi:tetratricopeptide (TPR) repeat protein